MGKTAIARQLVDEVLASFEYCIWLNLESAAQPLSELLLELNQELFSRFQGGQDSKISGSSSDLIGLLSQKRCLIVLDDWEVVCRNSQGDEKGYKGFLEKISITAHKSCFVIISRDNPWNGQLEAWGKAKSLGLQPLNYDEDKDLLDSNDLSGTEEELKRFLKIYDNPLALSLISKKVKNITGGNVSIFVREDATVLYPHDSPDDPMRDELNQIDKNQRMIVFSLLLWRSPVAYDQLLSETSGFLDQSTFLTSLSWLVDKSFVQRFEDELSYCLRPLVLKAATLYFADKLFDELVQIPKDNNFGEANILLTQHLVKDDNDETLKNEIIRRIIKPASIRLTDQLGGHEQAIKNLMKVKRMFEETQRNHEVGLKNINLLLEQLTDPYLDR